MNSILISEVLIKHVKYFQAVCPIDLLTSAIAKTSIIVINIDKHHMPVYISSGLFFRLWQRRAF